MKRVYLDNAGATPLDKRVLRVMMPFFKKTFGNPSAIYKEGAVANKALQLARESVAKTLKTSTYKVFFTGSGTESDNLAIKGIVNVSKQVVGKPHVITSVIEHPAVLNVVKKLEKNGEIEATYIPVEKNGIVNTIKIKEAIQKNTVLVSIMYANSEIGTIQPIKEIVRIVKEFRGLNKTIYPYVHTDACQAINYLDIFVEKLGVDLFTFNGSKIYGPKGVGILCVHKGVDIEPIIWGGGQESGLRSGTENVAYIVGVAKALDISEEMKEREVKRLIYIRDYFILRLLEKIPQVTLNGDVKKRLPNNIHITIPNIEDDVLVIELDSKGIACSSKSACKTSSGEDSHVVSAIDGVKGSYLRFSLGRHTTKRDVEYVVRVLFGILKKYKKI